MKEQNIQRRENQVIRQIFDRAGDLNKVMIVGLDYAENQHRAAACNGHGDLLCKPFWVHNDRKGLAFLETRTTRLSTKYAVEKENIILGGETPGSWAMNFSHNLRRKGWPVIDLHAKHVKKRRENETTDKDNLSALTICRCLIDKQGREHLQTGVYAELRMAVRFHDKLVKETTRLQNRMHSCVDTYFPGLLDPKQSGVPAFEETSLWLLENCSADREKSSERGAGQVQEKNEASREAVTTLGKKPSSGSVTVSTSGDCRNIVSIACNAR